MHMRSLILHLPTTLSLIFSAFAATAEDWQSKTIYQLVTDRFARDDNTAYNCDTSQRVHCGGKWAGITNHLDYIQEMGFDSIWISPIVKNIDVTTTFGEAYHGYWTKDMNALNPQFGTPDDLKNLSRSLHTRGMYLMLDVVINHLASSPTGHSNSEESLPVDFSQISSFPLESNFHKRCDIANFENQTEVEQCWLGNSGLPLPDLDTENKDIVQTVYAWIKELITEYGADGLRIDTVKHIRQDFWPDFAKAAGVFTMGEIISDKTNYTASYTNVLDSVLDYPGWYALTNAFGSVTGNLSRLVDVATTSQKNYKNGLFMTGSFLENHDQPRFQSITQDPSLIRNAMTWPFAHDGIPIMYYGQEQGFQGGGDPSNREALWSTGYDTQKLLVAHIRAMNGIRRVATACNKDFHTTPMRFIPQPDYSTLAMWKKPMLTLLTNIGNNGSEYTSWTIPGSEALYEPNETLVDVLTCTQLNVAPNGQVRAYSNRGMPQVLIPARCLSPSASMCPSRAIVKSDTVSKSTAQIKAKPAVMVLVFGMMLQYMTQF